jgi:hypothetical protein
VTRAQLSGVVKNLLSKNQRKHLSGAQKQKLLKPLAKAFIDKGIISRKGSKKYSKISRSDVTKMGN